MASHLQKPQLNAEFQKPANSVPKPRSLISPESQEEKGDGTDAETLEMERRKKLGLGRSISTPGGSVTITVDGGFEF